MRAANRSFQIIGSSAGDGGEARAQFRSDVRVGLHAEPKRLPCRWLYDPIGSELFEAICDVPEYYIPRAESEILAAHADEIAALFGPDASVVELGSGSARKTRLVLEAFLRRAAPAGRVRYVPIDISASALADSARSLGADYPRLDLHGIAGTYEEGLAALGTVPGPRLVVWLGSNVGNFSRPEAAAFLGQVRAQLRRDDRLLLGVDLRKDPAILQLAYDDPAGVTARFGLNLLARINRELGGRFDVDGFRFRAVYDASAGRMAMYLVSRRAQEVALPGLNMSVGFGAGEAIHIEDSYKYDPAEIDALAAAARLRRVAGWTDREGLFTDVVFAPA